MKYLHKYKETTKYKGSNGQYVSERQVKTSTKVYIKRPNGVRRYISWGTLVTLVAAVLNVAAKLMGSGESRNSTIFAGIVYI